MKCRFEIVGLSGIDGVPMHLKINRRKKYRRLLIKKVKEEEIKEINDVALLMEYNKKFLIIGNMNAITYKDIFPLIKNNQLWAGCKGFSGGMDFNVDDSTYDASKEKQTSKIVNGRIVKNIMGCIWFTNMEHNKRNKPLILTKKYDPEEYPKYDNYNAINVDKVKDIPCDYDGEIGVPISFLGNYNPDQFEIIGDACNGSGHQWDYFKPMIDGKFVYARILIKKKK